MGQSSQDVNILCCQRCLSIPYAPKQRKHDRNIKPHQKQISTIKPCTCHQSCTLDKSTQVENNLNCSFRITSY